MQKSEEGRYVHPIYTGISGSFGAVQVASSDLKGYLLAGAVRIVDLTAMIDV